jgi:hypothetical protein
MMYVMRFVCFIQGPLCHDKSRDSIDMLNARRHVGLHASEELILVRPITLQGGVSRQNLFAPLPRQKFQVPLATH